MCPLNMSDAPPPAPDPRAERVRAVVLDLLALHLQPHAVEDPEHQVGDALLVAREAVHVHELARRVDEAVAVDLHALDHRTCGRTCSPKSLICSWRLAPHSSSMTCVHPASLYSSIAAMQSLGRAGDRLALVEERVGDLRLRREPAALLHRLGDGADLVLLDAREIEQRVGGSLDVLHLVREIHAGDLAGAVAAFVAIRRVDRRDDRAADVDVRRDVLARVADERGRRDRRRQAAVADLAGELLHLRRRRRDIDGRHAAWRVRLGLHARARSRSTSSPCTRTPRRRARRARSPPRRASARASSTSASPRCSGRSSTCRSRG